MRRPDVNLLATDEMPAVGTDAAQALKLWVVLARAHAAITDRATADVARHGLTLAEFGILEALYHKGPMLLGEVQRRILVSSGGITYLVDRLVQRGLLERRLCAEDRRARYAALTEAGRALVERIFPEHAEMIRQALSGLSSTEQATAIGLLRTLGKSVG
ncbi:MAG: MarR family transcriptional regulator [Gemmatimonadaceae bacterium]|nr:MarR family transcriptional regulator [Gemmatimonadaceae bacterium]